MAFVSNAARILTKVSVIVRYRRKDAITKEKIFPFTHAQEKGA